MEKSIDLLEGKILPSLTKLALPIMATSVVQMAYNMTDMIWIGRIGSNAAAAVGAAGMYMWLSNGIVTMAKLGGQVKVGHALGAKENEKAVSFAKSAIQLGVILGLLIGIIAVLFAPALIGFFHLHNAEVITDAKIYLRITSGLILFSFLNQIFTGIMTAMGDSKTPFVATTVGLVINIIMDPLLIFGVGPFPRMEVMGAAVATVTAQAIVMLVFIIVLSKNALIFRKIHVFERLEWDSIRQIVGIGFPSAIQSMMFTCISMTIARMIARFGDANVAVQEVGSQIESISWMTSDGFAAAINAFIAQNIGAGNRERVKQGYITVMKIVLVWGTFCTLLLMGIPELIFGIFISEPEVLPMGAAYLRIIGASQLFMCMEITTTGAFAGLGKTIPPSVTGITLTVARIPLALILIQTVLGVNGIWCSIAISTFFKGTVLCLWFVVYLKKKVLSEINIGQSNINLLNE